MPLVAAQVVAVVQARSRLEQACRVVAGAVL